VTELTPVVRIGLLLLRPGMLVIVAPAFGSQFAPAPLRVAITLLLALTLAPVVMLPEAINPASIAVIATREVVIGLAIAFSVRIVVAAAEMAGHLAGFSLGFSYATLVDPLSGARNNTLSAFYGITALLMFFSIDGHHEMLRALASSYQALPVGVGGVSGDLASLVARILGMVFVVGGQLAAPVVLVLVVTEVALGVMARSMPTLNLMVSAAPVRLMVGLTALAATVPLLPPVIKGAVMPALELAARVAAVFR
jgi:flagellar biosynthetic protein FliR